ncbi:hypothetical protein FHT87_006051 [Rhizobium sp. BK316]|uniref:hypothetical protein n=1 Tax=Rhizobium sp. BK316 TaxID=2587053 RepID=UPI00160F4345|nr:hypothetical protein [Rhizobium sp. BK316]MBB3412081.1 hypothetical protein [Rhizobium sp. BK316]
MNVTRRNLIVGLSAISAGSIAAALTAAGRPALAMQMPAGNGEGQKVRRAVAYGTNAGYQKDTSGSTQMAFVRRKAYFLPYDIKAGELIEFSFPLWTLERPPRSPVLEVDLAEAYDFMLSMEYPFNDSSTSSPDLASRHRCLNTRDNKAIYSYVPGQPERMMVFTVAAPADIPAFTAIGGILLHECVAGRSGSVKNKAINSVVNASTFIGRRDGSFNSTTSLVSSDPTMTQTKFHAANGSQTGNPGTMLVGAIRVAVPADAVAIMSMGNSKLQGANEGMAGSGTFGDGGGDRYGNTGWGTRLACKLGLGCAQMSRGADSYNYQLISGIDRRMEFAAWCNPTHLLPCDPHNDTTQTSTPDWSQKTWEVDDTCRANGNAYIADTGGASGSITPHGTGKGIVDGDISWTYIGPDDMASTAGMSLVGKMRKLFRQYRAAMPHVKIIPPTLTPDTTSNVKASDYIYDSGTGDLTLTIPDVSKLVVGSNVGVAGLIPKAFNTSWKNYAQIRAIDGNRITVNLPAGLASPIGDASVNLTWSDPSYQVPRPGYAAHASFRSWINRFLRTNPNGALDMVVCADAGKWGEAGNPTTPAAETGAWAALPVDRVSLGGAFTSDGTHETSWGNDYIATQLAADPALVAVLQEAD